MWITAEDDVNALAHSFGEWVRSDEGGVAVEESKKMVEEMVEAARKDWFVDAQLLQQTITL